MPKQNICCCPAPVSALKMEELVALRESQKIVRIWFNTRLIEAKCDLEKTKLQRDRVRINLIRNRHRRK